MIKKAIISTFVFFLFITQSFAFGSLPDFETHFENLSPAVVNISTTQRLMKKAGLPKNLPPEMAPFGDLFEHFFQIDPRQLQEDLDDALTTNSLGSGFIISEDGYIVTNEHVVADADEIVVHLSDRRALKATLVGSDELSDIAVIKVEASNLPSVKIGESNKVKPGQWVFAIGSPFGFDHSITSGIVSAKGRALPGNTRHSSYVSFIQTDVAINPGNSGGPLFNLEGEVVGVNSQIYTRSGGYQGISFAIPIDEAMRVASQLQGGQGVSRGYLGALVQDVTQDLVEPLGLDRPSGALVAQLAIDSPARVSGLRQGDVILEVNGKDVISSSNLPALVGRLGAGSIADLTIVRNRKKQNLQITLGELPGSNTKISGANLGGKSVAPMSQVNTLGIATKTADAIALGKVNQEAGVQVTQVEKGSVAEKAGVRKGDVVTMLNNEKIETKEELDTVANKLKTGEAVVMLVHRSSGPNFLVIKK